MIHKTDTYQFLLYKFRKEHNLEHDMGDVVTNVLEEIVEVRKEHKANNLLDMVGEFTDVCVYCENALAQMNEPTTGLDFVIRDINVDKVLLDITMDICRFDRDKSAHIFRHILRKVSLLIDHLGFNFDKCMMETAKKITSRKGKMNQGTGKWEKSKTQDPYELYTPNYKACMKESVQ